MKKQILFGIFILGAILLTTGCGQTDVVSSVDNKKLIGVQDKNGKGVGSAFDRPENQIKGSIADLIVGAKIMAMGSANVDGTIMASRIVFGNFGGFGQGISSSTNPNRPKMTGDNWQGGNGSGGQKGGQGRSPGARGGVSGTIRINGEIIKKDQNSLIVKILDGGSKIVYFSSSTEIFSMKLSTSTPEFGISTTKK
ncbi:MAG: hypothetical protein Q7S24_00675 [bacterium]|nr:hypothetical protein [bacterium]